MITDADIKKLKSVFATKKDLGRFATKNGLKNAAKEIVEGVGDMIQTAIIPILDEHEKRLDRLEKRVGGFPPIA